LLVSCLVANNVFDDLGILNSGTYSLDHSLIGVGSGISIMDNGTNLIGTSVAPIDPLLAPLAFNGGKTQTHASKNGSLAINRGTNSAGLTTDQRGPGHARKLGAAVDIGAFEKR